MGSGLGNSWPATQHAALLAAARESVRAVASAGVEGLEPDHVRSHLREVSGLISSLELVRARAVRALESLSAPDLTGAASMVDFLSVECGLMPEAAKDRVVLGRQLESLTATTEALAVGQISLDTAALVARTAAAVAPEHAPEVERAVLEAAKAMAPASLRRVAEQVRAQVDAKAFEDSAERAYRNRALRLGPEREGLVAISGSLTSLAASHLRSAFQPYMKPTDASDSRTLEQRRHDALAAVCQKGGKSHVQVVAPVEALVSDGPAHALLEGLVPLSSADLRRVVEGGASISAVLKDARGQVALATRARNLTPAQRRVLVATTPTCGFEGCSLPAVQSTPHHLTEHCRGGPTELANEVPLCAAHHARVHRDGWFVRREPDGSHTTLPPGHPEIPIDRLSTQEYRDRVRRAREKRREARPKAPPSRAKRPP